MLCYKLLWLYLWFTLFQSSMCRSGYEADLAVSGHSLTASMCRSGYEADLAVSVVYFISILHVDLHMEADSEWPDIARSASYPDLHMEDWNKVNHRYSQICFIPWPTHGGWQWVTRYYLVTHCQPPCVGQGMKQIWLYLVTHCQPPRSASYPDLHMEEGNKVDHRYSQICFIPWPTHGGWQWVTRYSQICFIPWPTHGGLK
jgi:hypothetical protein